MPTPEQAQQLVEGGPWVILVLLVSLILFGVVKKDPWWVPGRVWRDERDRSDRLEKSLGRVTDFVARQSRRAGADPDD